MEKKNDLYGVLSEIIDLVRKAQIKCNLLHLVFNEKKFDESEESKIVEARFAIDLVDWLLDDVGEVLNNALLEKCEYKRYFSEDEMKKRIVEELETIRQSHPLFEHYEDS